MSIKLLVWDFDGTLVDSRPQIVAGMDHTLRYLNLGAEIKADWLRCVGLPVEDGLRTTFTPHGLTVEQVLPAYRGFDWTAHEYLLAPFPGIPALLTELKALGIRMGIATSKRGASLRRQLALFGWSDTFDPIVTPDEVQAGKPHPESLLQIMERTGLRPDELLMIGDTPFDLEMANRAGVPSLAVGHGFYDEAELRACGPVAFAQDVPALRQHLLDLVRA